MCGNLREYYKQENQLYQVNSLYKITTYRKVKIDEKTVRRVTEFFVGKKDAKGDYYELFSGVKMDMFENHEMEEFDKPFIAFIEPLGRYIKQETIDTKSIFYLILNINAFERIAFDVVD